MMTTPPQARANIDIPDGFDVAGLATLLDHEAMRERLNICLPRESARFDICRITNLRQKTRTSCTICYSLSRESDVGATSEFAYVRAFSNREFADAERRAQQSRWATTSDNLTITPMHDLCGIVYWFPNDERLDGLRRIVAPKKLQRLFYQYFLEYPQEAWRISDRSIRLQIIRYKPERRAVMRCRFRAQHKVDAERRERFVYLGLYEKERLAELVGATRRISEMSAAAQWWAVAPLIGFDREDALMIWEELVGTTLRSALAGNDWGDALARCARAIAEMHSTSATLLPRRDSISAQLLSVQSFLTGVLPERARMINDIARRIGEWNAATLHSHSSVVHGDLHAGQMILGNEKIGVIDLDRVHAGDPLEDVGNLRAQLWLGPPEGTRYEPSVVFDRFREAYSGSRVVDFRGLDAWTAFSLFRSASVPLGRFQSDWRSRACASLQEAERLLP